MELDLELQKLSISSSTIQLYVPRPERVKDMYLTKKDQDNQIPFPYWAKLWPSALALSEFIQENQEFFLHKEVLELATGLGLPSLVAAPFARQVCCSDYLPEALSVVEKSIAVNDFNNVHTRLLNWHSLPEEISPDVLLLSDINYDPRDFEVLYKVLNDFLQKGTTLFLSTPQRLMAKSFIEQLLPWCIQQKEITVSFNETYTPISVLMLKNFD